MASDVPRAADDDLRAGLARLGRQVATAGGTTGTRIGEEIERHLGVEVGELPVHGEELPAFELANLQLGLEAILAQPGLEARVLGLAGHLHRFPPIGLGDLLMGADLTVGPPEYVHAPVGPDETLA